MRRTGRVLENKTEGPNPTIEFDTRPLALPARAAALTETER